MELEMSGDVKQSLESAGVVGLAKGAGRSDSKRPVLLDQRPVLGRAGAAKLGLAHMSSMSDDSCHEVEPEDEGEDSGHKQQSSDFAMSGGQSLKKRKHGPSAQMPVAARLAARLQRMESVQQFMPTHSASNAAISYQDAVSKNQPAVHPAPVAEYLYSDAHLPHIVRLEAFFRMQRERKRYNRLRWATKVIQASWRLLGEKYILKGGGCVRAHRLGKVVANLSKMAPVVEGRRLREQARQWLRQLRDMDDHRLAQLRVFQKERQKKIFELASPANVASIRKPRSRASLCPPIISPAAASGAVYSASESLTEQNVQVEYEEAFQDNDKKNVAKPGASKERPRKAQVATLEQSSVVNTIQDTAVANSDH